VTLAFGRNEQDVKDMLFLYRRLGKEFGTPVDDVLFTRGSNAVILWDEKPDDLENGRLDGCMGPD